MLRMGNDDPYADEFVKALGLEPIKLRLRPSLPILFAKAFRRY